MRQKPQQGQPLSPLQHGIPAHVQHQVNIYLPGTPIKGYTNNAGSRMFLGIVLIIIGGIFIVGGLLLFLTLFSTGFSSLVLSGVAAVVTGLALFVNYGVVLIRRARRNRGAQVYLCTDGLLLIKNRGVEAIHWHQIIEIWQAFAVFSSYGRKSYMLNQFTLHRSDGAVLIVDAAFRGFSELVAEVERKVVSCLLPGALAAYHAGNAVSFGPISVHSQGISLNPEQRTLSWQELDKVKIATGLISFKGHSPLPLATVPTAQVPNACVFAALVSTVTDGQKLQSA